MSTSPSFTMIIEQSTSMEMSSTSLLWCKGSVAMAKGRGGWAVVEKRLDSHGERVGKHFIACDDVGVEQHAG